MASESLFSSATEGNDMVPTFADPRCPGWPRDCEAMRAAAVALAMISSRDSSAPVTISSALFLSIFFFFWVSFAVDAVEKKKERRGRRNKRMVLDDN